MIAINEKIMRRLVEYNPFWKAPQELEYSERDIYPDIKKLIKEPQIISLCGLRRVGKTTLLKRIIHDLLEENKADEIMYFSFDDFEAAELPEVIDAFRHINEKEPGFLIFDEVQKLPNWAEKIKVLYDTGKYKIFVSGSESLFLRKGSRESLAGRIYEFEISGLTFREYLGFAGKKKLASKPRLYEKELNLELKKYLLTAGFPELIGKEPELVKRYIKNSIMEKIVFLDMARLYPIENPQLLISILNILIDNPGMLVDFTSFSQELGISRQTVSRYFDYLESAHLVVKLYNFSKNRTTSEKRMRKYYPTFLSPALTGEKGESYYGKVIETICVLNSKAGFFWRDKYKNEVDVVLGSGRGLLPLEIKYRKTLEKNRGIEKFCTKHNCRHAVVITRDTRKTEKTFARIEWIPVYEFLINIPK